MGRCWNDSKLLLFVIAGVAVSAITGLTYMVTMFEDNQLETQSNQWVGVYGPLANDPDEWDIEFHKNWCTSNNGVWFETTECKWKNKEDRRNAFDNYKLNEVTVISDKLANQICDTMDIPCPENVTFEGYRLLKTGEIFYEGTSRGDVYRFKILNEQLFYMRDGIDEDWILSKSK